MLSSVSPMALSKVTASAAWILPKGSKVVALSLLLITPYLLISKDGTSHHVSG
jgi:hypothetical protein